MAGRRLDIRLFLEGIQVPFLGANINITTNQASTATIQVVATNTIFNVRPKTHVLLMFWDDAGDGSWRMLWEGQVLGVGYSKSPESRAAQLICRDMSNYWDYTLRHMVDAHSAVQIRNDKLYFYGNSDNYVRLGTSGQPVINSIASKLSGASNIPDVLQGLLKEFTDKIEAYKYVNESYKLNKQLFMKPDSNINKLIQATRFQDYINNVEGRNMGFTPVRELILQFCRIIYYNILSIPSAPYMNGTLNTFLLKPNLYGTIPPACNVILPDVCTSISYNRNFMAEPTRMMVHASPFPDASKIGQMLQPAYAVPEEVFQKLNGIPESQRLKDEYQGGQLLTAEEKEKGILPAESNISFPEWFALPGINNSTTAKDLRLAALKTVNYRFQMARYQNRTISAVTDINPWLVCNFPALICDSSRSYIGVVANINHTINAHGGGYTQMDCNLVYEVTDPAVEAEQAPSFPGWMNESYTPKKVDATYQEVLGCPAMEGEKSASVQYVSPDLNSGPATNQDGEARQPKISELVIGLYNSFDKNKDRNARRSSKYAAAKEAGAAYSFADAYRRRSVASLKDLAQFYGFTAAEKISNDFLPAELKSANDYFLASRKAVIEEYMGNPDVGIRASRVMDGR